MKTRKIELDAQNRATLARTFGVTIRNVSQALMFQRNSANAVRIREAALKMGGEMVEITTEVKKIAHTHTVRVLNSHGEEINRIEK